MGLATKEGLAEIDDGGGGMARTDSTLTLWADNYHKTSECLLPQACIAVLGPQTRLVPSTIEEPRL